MATPAANEDIAAISANIPVNLSEINSNNDPFFAAETQSSLTHENTWAWIVTALIIAFLIGTLNFGWSVKHCIHVGRTNKFNIALTICMGLWALHLLFMLILHLVVYRWGQYYSPEAAESIHHALLIMSRLTWSLATLGYVILVQLRFRVVKSVIRYHNVFDHLLMAVTVIVWLPSALVANAAYFAFPRMADENPYLAMWMNNFDVIWDTYYVVVDIVLGIIIMWFVIKSVRSLSQITSQPGYSSTTQLNQKTPNRQPSTSISSSGPQKERKLLRVIGFSLTVWIFISVVGIVCYYVANGIATSTPADASLAEVQYVFHLYNILNTANQIPVTLQFTLALLWLKEMKMLMEFKNKNMGRTGASSSGSRSGSGKQGPYSPNSPQSPYNRV
ncbi:hypothetical protein HK102_011765 [Quaeritorhiza haematococci]|nr:hypothetical protein HK102_011765 [Quaeritorhiza haematococci]